MIEMLSPVLSAQVAEGARKPLQRALTQGLATAISGSCTDGLPDEALA
ncbi:hypothetical protein [Sphingomonas xinjiangensis]|uniref:Uncharacterized protein n=1 Tax=Sphingomonas xinjiangensis TaxID=643568 RepID=A0A840YKK9_9SPHN|nr:hypothetical protein [Sphingomonas xinjiangensis]MBB5709570.1 hypothetical protein [Sphingomonas xinjiangensis]